MSETYMNEDGKVLCLLCNKGFNIISPTHLKKSHDITLLEYRKKFPGAPISSDAFKAKQRFSESLIFNEEETIAYETNVVQEIDSKVDNDEVLEKMKMEQSEILLRTQIPFEDKRKIFVYLQRLFPRIQNNFEIQIFTLSGLLELNTITDMADPENKIDFEFPSSWWHNQDRRIDLTRTSKLEKLGWRVVVFDKIPSDKEIDEKISNLM